MDLQYLATVETALPTVQGIAKAVCTFANCLTYHLPVNLEPQYLSRLQTAYSTPPGPWLHWIFDVSAAAHC